MSLKITGKFILTALIMACAFAVAANPRLPYNYRLIDNHIHVGGHPLNPVTSFKSTDKETREILNYLKSKGIKTVIDLENSWWIQDRYARLLKQARLERLHIPLNAYKIPNVKEWRKIKEAMQSPVYIHCKWGADRAGAIIGRYLIEEKGYSPEKAYQAVITGGSCAGPSGGLKKGWAYENLKRFIWHGPR